MSKIEVKDLFLVFGSAKRQAMKMLKEGKSKQEIHRRTKCTSYVARHSWATTAKEEGVAISLISESLGHTSEQITHVYLASFNNNTISEVNKKVISTILFDKKKKRKKK